MDALKIPVILFVFIYLCEGTFYFKPKLYFPPIPNGLGPFRKYPKIKPIKFPVFHEVFPLQKPFYIKPGIITHPIKPLPAIMKKHKFHRHLKGPKLPKHLHKRKPHMYIHSRPRHMKDAPPHPQSLPLDMQHTHLHEHNPSPKLPSKFFNRLRHIPYNFHVHVPLKGQIYGHAHGLGPNGSGPFEPHTHNPPKLPFLIRRKKLRLNPRFNRRIKTDTFLPTGILPPLNLPKSKPGLSKYDLWLRKINRWMMKNQHGGLGVDLVSEHDQHLTTQKPPNLNRIPGPLMNNMPEVKNLNVRQRKGPIQNLFVISPTNKNKKEEKSTKGIPVVDFQKAAIVKKTFFATPQSPIKGDIAINPTPPVMGIPVYIDTIGPPFDIDTVGPSDVVPPPIKVVEDPLVTTVDEGDKNRVLINRLPDKILNENSNGLPGISVAGDTNGPSIVPFPGSVNDLSYGVDLSMFPGLDLNGESLIIEPNIPRKLGKIPENVEPFPLDLTTLGFPDFIPKSSNKEKEPYVLKPLEPIVKLIGRDSGSNNKKPTSEIESGANVTNKNETENGTIPSPTKNQQPGGSEITHQNLMHPGYVIMQERTLDENKTESTNSTSTTSTTPIIPIETRLTDKPIQKPKGDQLIFPNEFHSKPRRGDTTPTFTTFGPHREYIMPEPLTRPLLMATSTAPVSTTVRTTTEPTTTAPVFKTFIQQNLIPKPIYQVENKTTTGDGQVVNDIHQVIQEQMKNDTGFFRPVPYTMNISFPFISISNPTTTLSPDLQTDNQTTANNTTTSTTMKMAVSTTTQIYSTQTTEQTTTSTETTTPFVPTLTTVQTTSQLMNATEMNKTTTIQVITSVTPSTPSTIINKETTTILFDQTSSKSSTTPDNAGLNSEEYLTGVPYITTTPDITTTMLGTTFDYYTMEPEVNTSEIFVYNNVTTIPNDPSETSPSVFPTMIQKAMDHTNLTKTTPSSETRTTKNLTDTTLAIRYFPDNSSYVSNGTTTETVAYKSEEVSSTQPTVQTTETPASSTMFISQRTGKTTHYKIDSSERTFSTSNSDTTTVSKPSAPDITTQSVMKISSTEVTSDNESTARTTIENEHSDNYSDFTSQAVTETITTTTVTPSFSPVMTVDIVSLANDISAASTTQVPFVSTTQNSARTTDVDEIETTTYRESLDCRETKCRIGYECAQSNTWLCPPDNINASCSCTPGCKAGRIFIPLGESFQTDECGSTCSCFNLYGNPECTHKECENIYVPDPTKGSKNYTGISIGGTIYIPVQKIRIPNKNDANNDESNPDYTFGISIGGIIYIPTRNHSNTPPDKNTDWTAGISLGGVIYVPRHKNGGRKNSEIDSENVIENRNTQWTKGITIGGIIYVPIHKTKKTHQEKNKEIENITDKTKIADASIIKVDTPYGTTRGISIGGVIYIPNRKKNQTLYEIGVTELKTKDENTNSVQVEYPSGWTKGITIGGIIYVPVRRRERVETNPAYISPDIIETQTKIYISKTAGISIGGVINVPKTKTRKKDKEKKDSFS